MAYVRTTATTNAAGCLLPTQGRAREYHQIEPKIRDGDGGYVRWANAGEPDRRVLIHQLALLAATGQTPGAGQDVSHRCANARCANYHHLVLESHDINMARRWCVGTIRGRLRFQRSSHSLLTSSRDAPVRAYGLQPASLVRAFRLLPQAGMPQGDPASIVEFKVFPLPMIK